MLTSSHDQEHPGDLEDWETFYKISLAPRKAAAADGDADYEGEWRDTWNNLIGESRLQHKPTEED